MFAGLKLIITHFLTEKDGESFEITRFGMFAGIIVLVLALVYGLSRVAEIKLPEVGELMKSFGYSLGGLLGAGGAGIAMKSKTENE